MNSKDIEYLFANTPFTEKNIYPQELLRDTLRLHTRFLENSPIHFKTSSRVINKRTIKYIHVLRADNATEIAKVSSVSYAKTNARIGSFIANDKFKTEKHLQNFGINTPNSRVYASDEMEKAKRETFGDSDNPVVIKPLISTMSQGVRVNVSEDRFDYNWQEASKFSNSSQGKILVQNYLDGFEARATVVQGKLLSIMARIPPYVVGNGQDTIEKLLEIKSEERESCGFLKRIPMRMTDIMHDFLETQGLTVNHVPEEGEYVLLSSISNVAHGGGEIMNITDLVSDEIRNLPLNTLSTMPGTYTAGVDLIMKSLDDETPVVLEINPFPGISNTNYPTYGEPANPSKAYFESLVVLDQFINQPDYKYNIEGEDNYIRNYLSFVERGKTMLINNFDKLHKLT